MTQATFDATDYRGTTPENYEKFFVPVIGEPLALDLVAAAALQPGERIVDVACGTGVVARLAARRVGQQASVAGLDNNPGMLAVARAVTPSEMAIDWYETSAEAMPLVDHSFDVVLCQMGLQFMVDRRKALKEIRRILQPGGRLLLNLPGPTPAPFAALAEALARHIDPRCAGFVEAVFSLHDSSELGQLATETGFSSVDVHRTQTTLRLPGDFLWQYIHATPLAALVGKASDEQRRRVGDEVGQRWQQDVVDGSLRLELGVTTLRAA